jgi:predicted double-glycine peptidase
MDWFLHDNGMKPRFTFHFNVISGIEKQHIYVNDPDWGKVLGGKHQYKINDYLYAVYASAYGAIDNASFMKIRYRGEKAD